MNESEAKLITALNQLHERIKQLETAAKQKPEEAQGGRPGDDRNDRKEALDLKRYVKGDAKPINPARREEIRHRYNTLHSPAQPVKRPHSKPAEGSAAISFYCWRNGELVLVSIKVAGSPTEVTP